MISRRRFLHHSGFAAFASSLASHSVLHADSLQMPFANGKRDLVRYPEKRPLIRLTSRPPQLETPFEVFNEGVLTPNDAFFVRYHLADIPLEVDPETFRLRVGGKVQKSLNLSLSELRTHFEPHEVVAVNQCSGNGRAFFQPRVPGGQLGNGAMGNARWKGVRLKDVLEKAGIEAGARHVLFDGLDRPVDAGTPDYVKSLPLDHVLEGEVLIAYSMNGEDLPMLNGYPLRLVVPGYYGTYWVKHLSEITVVDESFNGFWVGTAYRIPDTVGACVEPGTVAKSTVPIGRFNVRSFLTSARHGDVWKVGEQKLLRGIAFDGGGGIREVIVSLDGGATWMGTVLGEDLGRYSFREWTLRWTPTRPGPLEIRVRASNRLGESQPLEPLWNPAGYMRNVVEVTHLQVIS